MNRSSSRTIVSHQPAASFVGLRPTLLALGVGIGALAAVLAPLAARASEQAAMIPVAAQADAGEGLAGAVRALIGVQMKALRGLDTEAFAGTIAMGLRTRFGDADTLYGVLTAKTPELVEAEITAFGPLKQTKFGLTQAVRLSDREGRPWLAFFMIEQDESGALFVNNLVATKLPGTVV